MHSIRMRRESPSGKCGWARVGRSAAWSGALPRTSRIYVANSDVRFLRDGTRRLDPAAGGGLFALNLPDGKITMQVPPVPCGSRDQCSPALSAAVSVIPGVVFSGGVSGFLRAYLFDRRRASALGV
jgi:polyvinyl alcohol dehydrogenase (cytochrome)